MGSAEARATTNGATAAPVTAIAGAMAHTKVSVKANAKMVRAARQKARAAKAVSTARKQIGDPYRWGATGPRAFDCSGLVQYSWRSAGVKLPRITHSQYRAVRKKVSWRSLRPGDLLFFYGKGHVGIYVGKGRMVHSPSSGKRVRIVKLKGYYRSSFAGAVRPGA
ncbi:C40 family peptidase [Planomonospora sp. ID67723]|uniref:C40 family peptidase n=1 Tax=Planomonospora sp. ID67723 TaxID=2738134 RepID=UPI0018C3B71A|nr:C40 family peptidase [Planomonospora sp. ID67723]MBG0829354.1 C40 family peptidase [Planomonospora sp. ID67723]